MENLYPGSWLPSRLGTWQAGYPMSWLHAKWVYKRRRVADIRRMASYGRGRRQAVDIKWIEGCRAIWVFLAWSPSGLGCKTCNGNNISSEST
ncbi:hypothetical protein GOBAR_DD05328 [Gossypium barbadense]|nr:hypothetical protein GOBAR_DD05328 [Gossypium barbadense]